MRQYVTKGSYPKVIGARVRVRRVNAVLRDAVLTDQRVYARRARREIRRAPYPGPGLYETSPDRQLMSASTVVVSALIPAEELYPGGTDGSAWISATVRVPSGARVRLAALFASPPAGRAALAAATRTIVRRTNRCVRKSLDDPLNGDLFLAALEPTRRNYRDFALTPNGVVVGFPNGEIAQAVRSGRKSDSALTNTSSCLVVQHS